MSPDLSVLIPARNEMWLKRTVEDVLAHSGGRTHVLVVLDGQLPADGLEQHARLDVLYHAEPIGQRAATNLAARVSSAPYVMKLDAHCAVAPGFDEAILDAFETLGPRVVQIPRQYNLHIFDWVCDACQARRYQGPTPASCSCGATAFHRDIVWNAVRRQNDFFRFDADLKFQYWGGRKTHPEAAGDFPETMSCLGACWCLSREWYLGALEGMDEAHGSWGQMGTELACKAWLSGGRMVTNRRTWFSHLFRTQGGDFGFPYEIHGDQQEYARVYSRNLWRGNHWPGQVYPLRWLVDKFWPVPGWTEAQRDELPQSLSGRLRASHRTDGRASPAGLHRGPEEDRGGLQSGTCAGLVYYTDNRGDRAILDACRDHLMAGAEGRPIVAVALEPIDWPGVDVVLLSAPRGPLTMFRQILAGLEALDTEIAFLVEHDVLYSPEHFRFSPPQPDVYFYNTSVWHVDAATGHAITYRAKRTSQLCANRALLIEHYRKRIARVKAEGFSLAMGYEPGSHGREARVDDIRAEEWRSIVPNIDIRHGDNLTLSRWTPEQFRSQKNCQDWQESDTVPGWGRTEGRFPSFLASLSRQELTV